jgi:hypothetical protein
MFVTSQEEFLIFGVAPFLRHLRLFLIQNDKGKEKEKQEKNRDSVGSNKDRDSAIHSKTNTEQFVELMDSFLRVSEEREWKKRGEIFTLTFIPFFLHFSFIRFSLTALYIQINRRFSFN